MVRISKEEKKIFIIHLIYSVLEGITLGAFALNEFVFLKSLNGSDFQVAVLLQFSMVVFLFAVVFNELIKRFKKQSTLRYTALITRLPLFLVLLFPQTELTGSEMWTYNYIFLGIFFMYYLATPVVYPIINSILKNNYKDQNFGKYYGYATTVNKVFMLVTTFIFGIWLDSNYYAYIYLYPVLAVLSIFSIYLLASAVKVNYIENNDEKQSYLNFIKILQTNKPYRDFEIGFMLYGIAFMLTIAVISVFLADKLELNYTSLSFYKNSYNVVAILTLPLFGSMIGKMDPRKFGAFSFFTLLMYIFFMGLTEYFPYYFDWGNYRFYWLLLISFFFNGLFAGSMPLLWNIGSAYFCGKDEVASYQSIHLSLVGLRGVFAPLFGIGLYKIIGFSGVFALGIFFLILSIIVMFWSVKRKKLLKRRY